MTLLVFGLPPTKGGLWHVFRGLRTLCGKVELVEPLRLTMPFEENAWVRGQDCKSCWAAAELPVGDGCRVEVPT